ncbi:4-hydroxythreonine-4-phosphate dehydrogenase [Prochlorococcus sp. MIT 1341]|uniref:4-hydroxythreonine-4-phosphate dehydrogenase n=1 Tax=Prochlorococcus sp. MIT 1341 TaxID=3096221 RepID=UPI002A764B95|nr:4-hydroxythreonine-4-phosphate dehydrogenase [Prochlorococcus sp. MIT 1341]
MLRWLFIGLLLFGFGRGLQNGWIVVKWSQFFHEVGFTDVDPNKPMNWSEFILGEPNQE